MAGGCGEDVLPSHRSERQSSRILQNLPIAISSSLTEADRESGLVIERLRAGYAAVDDANACRVHEVSMEVAEGECLAIVGPSGGGKTSLLLAIAGLIRQYSGQIELDGRRIDHLPPHRRSIAMMSQGESLFPHQSVRQNIIGSITAKSGKWFGGVSSAAQERALQFCETAGIGDLLDRLPEELSGGQQRRAALVRCLSSGRSITLLDEPLSELDPALNNQLTQWIYDWHRRSKGITICVTHDFATALQLGDRVAVIDQGRVLQCDAPAALGSDPVHLSVARACALHPLQELPLGAVVGRPTWVPPTAKRFAFPAQSCEPKGKQNDDAAWVEIDVADVRSIGLSMHCLSVANSCGKHSGSEKVDEIISQPFSSSGLQTILVQCDCGEVPRGKWRIHRRDVFWFDTKGNRLKPAS